jgi:RimJ/RimL family protein N-acetyltransferase
MNPEWLTARLRVRRPLQSDEPAYLALFLKPAVGMRLRPPPLPAFTAPQVGAMLSEDIHHWDEHGFGPWALLDRESGSFLGRGGLQCTAVEGEPMVELPWVIEPDREGEGLATEAALAAIEWARSLALGEVVAMITLGNLASRRVAEKAGLRPSGEIEHVGIAHFLYRLSLSGPETV